MYEAIGDKGLQVKKLEHRSSRLSALLDYVFGEETSVAHVKLGHG